MRVLITFIVGILCTSLGALASLLLAADARHINPLDMTDLFVLGVVAFQLVGGSWLTMRAAVADSYDLRALQQEPKP